jgi:uncharacterized surface protein with fasciclin (FAS1) repeats
MISWLKRMCAFSTVALVAACGGSNDDVAPAPAPIKNIVEVAQTNPDLSILVEAVVAADLVGTLSAPGGTTGLAVFAPTNAAFAALLTELGITKAALLADKPLLTSVLTYHVLPARVFKANIPFGEHLTSLQGGFFKIEEVDPAIVITDARNRTSNITATDIVANNGIIHVIDKVLLPGNKTIVATAQGLPDFSILVDAIGAAGLATTLSGTGPYTVFAPTNAAFTALLAELNITKAALLADTVLLTKVLKYHVLDGVVLKAEVPVAKDITTLEGETFKVSKTFVITDQRARLSNITATDVLTSNGVIHQIDKVILPKP